MSSPITPDRRCPRCHAAVGAGAGWCSLCYVDLRPAAGPSGTSAPPDPGPPAAPPGWDVMLAVLAAERRDPLGWAAGVTATGARKVAVMVGGTLVLTAVLVGVLAALGAFL